MGFLGWIFVACLLVGAGYLAAVKTAEFLITLGGVAAFILLSPNQTRREKRQLLAVASQREGQTICEFARDFDARAVDTWIIRAVYEQLQEQLAHVHPNFPVRADDRLKEDLLLHDDDVDMDFAAEVEMRTGRPIDNSEGNPYAGKVKTVRDAVLFFQHQPKAVRR